MIISSGRCDNIQGRRWLEVQQKQNIEAEMLLFESAKQNSDKLTAGEREHNKNAATTIVQKLGYMPLAIDQAGAHIYVQEAAKVGALLPYQDEVITEAGIQMEAKTLRARERQAKFEVQTTAEVRRAGYYDGRPIGKERSYSLGYKIGRTEYRWCKEEEETVEHIWNSCEVWKRKWSRE
ncbi:hypothetical protein BDZ91DRAFT_790239 [Kalaharituber pfeilii]|nr:hypothetical protein BDZ91DRAFT_790239 [Kalaharituber pfeilii]